VQCLWEQPRLLALGLGGHDTPLARMLQALRWTSVTVPMRARLVRPARVLRYAPALRQTRARRAAADVLAVTGLGRLLASAWDIASGARRRRRRHDYSGEACEVIGRWGEELWLRTRDRYPFIAARDPRTVESLLPQSRDVIRLRVRHRGEDVAWICAVRHDFSVGTPDRNFGTLTVGLLADVLASPEHVEGALAAGLTELESHGVDIVVSNQLNAQVIDALRRMGLRSAPSNFALYTSPAATKLIGDWSQAHVNRGDCDGPIWYRGV
jgi:hypothetical protein